MKKIIRFLLLGFVTAVLSSCGTDMITVPDDASGNNGAVVYMSPADGHTEATTTTESNVDTPKADRRFIVSLN